MNKKKKNIITHSIKTTKEAAITTAIAKAGVTPRRSGIEW